jgi:hypothetical protein
MRARFSAFLIAGTFVCLAATGLLSRGAYADDASCKPLADAMIADSKTPYHTTTAITYDYSVPVAEAKSKMKLPDSQASETIFTGTAVYIRQVPGKWQTLPGTIADFQENVRTGASGFKECKKLPDETVNGSVLSVYQGKATPRDRLVILKLWISPKGIPLKSETDIEIGQSAGGDMIHQHLSTNYDYDKVTAPSMN